MAKKVHKKESANGKTAKEGFRVVKESPATTKISKATIDQAVEKALSTTSR
jgi:hypothetical protein